MNSDGASGVSPALPVCARPLGPPIPMPMAQDCWHLSWHCPCQPLRTVGTCAAAAAAWLARSCPQPCAAMSLLRPCPQPCPQPCLCQALACRRDSCLVTTSGCAPLPLVGAVGQVPCAVPAPSLTEPLVLPVSPQPRLRWDSPWEEVGEAQGVCHATRPSKGRKSKDKEIWDSLKRKPAVVTN